MWKGEKFWWKSREAEKEWKVYSDTVGFPFCTEYMRNKLVCYHMGYLVDTSVYS